MTSGHTMLSLSIWINLICMLLLLYTNINIYISKYRTIWSPRTLSTLLAMRQLNIFTLETKISVYIHSHANCLLRLLSRLWIRDVLHHSVPLHIWISCLNGRRGLGILVNVIILENSVDKLASFRCTLVINIHYMEIWLVHLNL